MVIKNRKNSSPEDAYDEAVYKMAAGKHKAAFELLKEAFLGGCKEASLNLGYCYDNGIGTEKNSILALFYYQKAFEKGESAGAMNAAILFEEQGDFNNAFAWWNKALEMGDGESALGLAKLHIRHGDMSLSRRIKKLLLYAKNSSSTTEAGKEEAIELLNSLGS